MYHYATGKMGGPYSDKTAVWLAAEHNKLRALRFLLAAAGWPGPTRTSTTRAGTAHERNFAKQQIRAAAG